MAETSEHGVSRTSSFYCTYVFVVSRNRSLSRTVVIHLGKERKQTRKTCSSLPPQRSQNHSESLRSVYCAVTGCWLLCVLSELPVRGADMHSKGKGHPRTGHKVHRYSSTLPLTSALDGGWWSTPQPGRFTPGKEPVPIVQEVGWAVGQVGTDAENLAPTGIRSPDRPARSESLYRLSCLGPRAAMWHP
jgi:hypothetical protein